MNEIQFLLGTPAFIYKKHLVVADLHLGLEDRLRKQGIYLANLSEAIVRSLNDLYENYDFSKILILGDIKDSIQYTPDNLAELLCKFPTDSILVKGNHDGSFSHPFFEITPYYALDDMLFIHGHTRVPPEFQNFKKLVMAHIHPFFNYSIEGEKHAEPVWLFSPKESDKELIVVPSFNPVLGNNIRSLDQSVSPVFRNNLFKWNALLIYSLKGLFLGNVKDIIQ